MFYTAVCMFMCLKSQHVELQGVVPPSVQGGTRPTVRPTDPAWPPSSIVESPSLHAASKDDICQSLHFQMRWAKLDVYKWDVSLCFRSSSRSGKNHSAISLCQSNSAICSDIFTYIIQLLLLEYLIKFNNTLEQLLQFHSAAVASIITAIVLIYLVARFNNLCDCHQ